MQELKELESDKADLENAMKEVNEILRQERKKMEDIFENMKEELKSNMQMSEVRHCKQVISRVLG